MVHQLPISRYNEGAYYPDADRGMHRPMNVPPPHYSSQNVAGGRGGDRFRERATMDRERAYHDQVDSYGDEEFMSTPQQMKRQMRGDSMGRDMGHNRGSQNSRNSDGNYIAGYRNSMQKSPGSYLVWGSW